MTRINIDRLLRLAHFIRGLGRKDFDMLTWKEAKLEKDELLVHKASRAIHCKMVCCIGGWATLFHPELIINHSGLVHKGTKKRGFDAFASAFGMNNPDAISLTRGEAPHQTPKAAATAIEKVAKEYATEEGYNIVPG